MVEPGGPGGFRSPAIAVLGKKKTRDKEIITKSVRIKLLGFLIFSSSLFYCTGICYLRFEAWKMFFLTFNKFKVRIYMNSSLESEAAGPQQKYAEQVWLYLVKPLISRFVK
jgi:hypothetical protein